jgi:AbiU2
MKIEDPKITNLRAMVTAAQQEFDLAVTFHAVWKPMVYDQDLHGRFGASYATQAFRVIRTALRREIVLALIRLWDNDTRAVGMERIAKALRNEDVIDALALERGYHSDSPGIFDAIRDDLRKKAAEAILLIDKYITSDGAGRLVYEKLRALRNERLAHRQVTEAEEAEVTGATTTDEEIEGFYHDNSKLVHILLGTVNAMAYDPQDTAEVFGFYANHFWGRFQKTEVKRDGRMLSA